MPYSIIFMGTPDFAREALRSLYDAGHEILSVYTQAPKPTGRRYVLQKSSVHEFADEIGLRVFTPKTLRSQDVQDEIAKQNPDLIIVAAYGFIIPKVILDIPKYGCINIHASILPRWRGAAPIHHAIMSGDSKTGITIMKMDVGMDTGDIIRIQEILTNEETTLGDLTIALSQLGAKMIMEVLKDLRKNLESSYKQPKEGITIAGKITKDMEQIDWTKSADEIERNIRAFYPAPCMWSEIDGIRLKVESAQCVGNFENHGSGGIGIIMDKNFVVSCGNGTFLKLINVKPEGRSSMSGNSFINGKKNIIGKSFIGKMTDEKIY